MTRTTPELAPTSPNFHTTTAGGLLATTYDLIRNRHPYTVEHLWNFEPSGPEAETLLTSLYNGENCACHLDLLTLRDWVQNLIMVHNFEVKTYAEFPFSGLLRFSVIAFTYMRKKQTVNPLTDLV
ncbi:hypothetical protein AVEN_203187-1 [Araneus ventricosus]|uniref:Uncharacterized protein n=1 Tax=Araneus ventricosus TaxID=182803 RepID=A0A4Y2CHF9_ARAVE|nr:hypothetical protein AVEN_203187-1 [Araneus ventricosus]